MNKIGLLVSEKWSDKVKSRGRIYSGRRIYLAKYGMLGNVGGSLKCAGIVQISLMLVGTVKPVWNDRLWKDHSVWKDQFSQFVFNTN